MKTGSRTLSVPKNIEEVTTVHGCQSGSYRWQTIPSKRELVDWPLARLAQSKVFHIHVVAVFLLDLVR